MKKLVKGQTKQDWEISQVGLSFEHGGTIGSANHRGPILLASHAGMFVRLFSLTHDSLFLTMARAAALGRDAFVDKKTNVASYYWDAMDNGPGAFPASCLVADRLDHRLSFVRSNIAFER